MSVVGQDALDWHLLWFGPAASPQLNYVNKTYAQFILLTWDKIEMVTQVLKMDMNP